MQANQSVLEEEEEEDDDGHTVGDIEAGHVNRSPTSSTSRGQQRHVAWDGNASEMSVLRPNIKQDDEKHENDSSDGEVPQDFMIEAAAPPMAARKPQSPKTSRTTAYKGKTREARRQPLYSTGRKPTPPILPTSTPVSIPPRPSELDVNEGASAPSQLAEQQSKQMRGLDAYERALWNWVNVYNLDEFLQEAYYYYEGKGIYSIALSRGLNLLSVITCSYPPTRRVIDCCS
jgi:autophagy-related protein 9